MIKRMLILLSIPAISLASDSACDRREFVPLEAINGQWMRVHPSGNYLLVGEPSGTSLIDLTDKEKPKISKTGMKQESTPVQASDGWRWVVSPHNNGKTKFFSFEALTKNPQTKEAAFDDAFSYFYSSAAELVGGDVKTKVIRAIISSKTYRDYEITLDEKGTVSSVKIISTKPLCSNIEEPLIDPLLSVDGTEVSFQVYSTKPPRAPMGRIYKIDGEKCIVDRDTEISGSKMVFNFPVKGKKGLVAYKAGDFRGEASGSATDRFREAIRIYDRDKKKEYVVSLENEDSNFPNFISGDKIVFQSRKRDSNEVGLTVVRISDAIECAESPEVRKEKNSKSKQ